MLPYYARFIARFPDVTTLAEASFDEVLTHWQGLGYYRRAKHVHEAAKRVHELHHDQFPPSIDALRALPGVGEYTAGAIASIAFDQAEPAVDGNVLRVVSRLYGITESIAEAKTKAAVTSRVKTWYGDTPPHELTQAIMELGALICVRKPSCEACPLNRHCFAYAHGKTDMIPVKPSRMKQPLEHYVTFVVTHNESIYLEQNPDDGLLANLYACPQVEGKNPHDAFETLKARIPFSVTLGETLGDVTHVFSHKRWKLIVVHVLAGESSDMFYPLEDLPALGKAHRTAIELWEKKLMQ